MEKYVLLEAVTANGDSAIKELPAQKTFTGFVTGTGAVTATLTIKGSADGVHWKTLGTLTLTGTSPQTDGLANNEAWKFVMATLSNLTGTGAAASLVAAG